MGLQGSTQAAMTDISSRTGEAELDFSEFFRTVWKGKWIIMLSMVMAVILGGYFLVNSQEEYTAEAVFALEERESLQVPSSYGDAASLFLGETRDDQGIFDRLEGRDFILRLAGDLDLEDDEYFNPPAQEPRLFSLAGLMSLAGLYEPGPRDTDDTIVSAYRRNVELSETKSDSIKVSVNHENPTQAARIANAIVHRAIGEIEEEEKVSHRNQLNYLSEQLADSLEEVEAAKNAVAESSINNGRVSLDLLKREERIAEANYNALVEQVRMKSLAMGYPGERAKIYQLAAPPQAPSSPNPPVIIAVSLALGALLGIGLALLFVRWRGQVHSVSTIAGMTGAPIIVRTSALRKLRRPPRLWRAEEYDRVGDPALLELAAAVLSAEKKIVLVASTGLRISPLPVALWLANTSAGHGRSTALMLLGVSPPSSLAAAPGQEMAIDRFGKADVLHSQSRNSLDALSSLRTAGMMIEDDSRYDILILAASSRYATTAARALSRADPFSILVTQEGYSRRNVLERITEAATIDAVVNLQ